MAMQILNFREDTLNLQKYKKKPKGSNLKPFWVFLVSIFIYISVFYIFSLSPSALLYTTKFWFLISNTLILIIAADYGAFSPSSKEHMFYDEYVKSSTLRSAKVSPPFEITPYVEKTTIDDQQGEAHEKPHEKTLNMVVNHEPKEEGSNSKPDKIILHGENDLAGSMSNEVGKKKKDRKRVRSINSDKAIIVASDHEDEFSSMSDEELNRRVEEFIRRFNRQIRLQATSARQNLELA